MEAAQTKPRTGRGAGTRGRDLHVGRRLGAYMAEMDMAKAMKDIDGHGPGREGAE